MLSTYSQEQIMKITPEQWRRDFIRVGRMFEKPWEERSELERQLTMSGICHAMEQARIRWCGSWTVSLICHIFKVSFLDVTRASCTRLQGYTHDDERITQADHLRATAAYLLAQLTPEEAIEIACASEPRVKW